ncbi:MAG: hypothetical protein PF489_04395 [Salinivirgaceae bacterium]|jgi:hypothetical protein|nr:hypothetical protein [Salinivirgaceae bacterium]
MSFFKEPKNVLDLFTYDLTTFFYEDYNEINSEEILDTVLIDYEKTLPWKELEVFNRVVFRVFIEKSNVTGTNHINVTCFADDGYAKEDLVKIIEKITRIAGIDDNRKGFWSDSDDENYENGFIDRMWTLGKNDNIYSLRLTYDPEQGPQFSILFFTNLLKNLGKL